MQTATNPQTGEKVQWDGSNWVPVQQSAPAPTIYRTPPKPLAPQRPAEARSDVLSNSQKEADLSKSPYELRSAAAGAVKAEADAEVARLKAEAASGKKSGTAQQAAVRDLQAVIRKIDEIGLDAKDNDGWFETGTSGALSRQFLPEGTAGFDLAENLKTIDANSAFTSLQAMRDASPTGGALGQITERELDLLKAKVANLNPNLSQEAFLANLQDAREFYVGMLERAGGVDEGTETPSPSGLNDDDVKAVGAFIQSNPDLSPDELRGYIRGTYGLDVQNADEILAHFGKTGQTPTAAVNDADALFDQFHAGVGDIAEGVGDTLGLIGNPLNTGINAALGTNLSTDLGQTFREATGAPDNASPLASAINKGGASVLTGAGAATGLARGAGMAGNAVVGALSQQPIQQGVAGAASGAAGDLTRQAGGGELAQAGASLAGGVGSFAGTNALLRAAQPKTLAPVAQAAQRQGVDLMPAQTGGQGTRALTAGARQGFVSDIPITKGVEKQAAQTSAVRNRAARSVGDALDKEDAGELLRSAANIYSKKTGEVGGRLYTRANKLAGDTQVPLPKAISVLDDHIKELEGTVDGGGALLKEFKTLRKNMAKGTFDVAGVRASRTRLREEADFKGLRGSDTNRRYKMVMDAASEDIVDGLTKAGKEGAARAFKTADAFWRKRVETIDEVLEPLLGKNSQKSGENIVSAFERMANRETGNAENLRRLMQALPKAEARNIRATVIQRLGRPTAANANDADFSLGKFLTDYNKMSSKAKSLVFTGESRKALDDLAKIAKESKDADRLLNTSNTARSVGVQAAISGTAGLLISPFMAGTIAGGQFALGKLLASPKFANWLAKMPANPAAQKQYAKRLSAIASAEPVIANDIKSVQSFLNNSLSASPGRAAAQNEADSRGKPPAQ
ncbi:hypothetical protein [Sphingorhabdus sp. SMR4y]|uniref:hypothetical protein n=1 Tax=Sphingorhabdus sp. SMR4y TaxID=2584094 RepID=UPI000B5C7ECF|nr:hypothetical protein [Sphingorhabdus sp. SMR4y]ASK88456.1 hypothetical protein SPHFLASMR4Y_01709 [Sphingorhabdus sp. SMR4y]